MRLSEKELEELLKKGNAKIRTETPVKTINKELVAKQKKRRVAGNTVEIDGHIFRSGKEAEIYQEYKIDPNVEIISLQPRFFLMPSFKRNGKTIRGVSYKADFHIRDCGIEWIVEVKSIGSILANSKSYPIRKKLFLFKHPDLRFREIIFDNKKRTVTEY